MTNKLLLGLWRAMIPVPGMIWKGQVAKSAQDAVARLDFMSDEHHLVRDLAVRELPRVGQPLSPHFIAGELGLTIVRVVELLDELEKRKTFLYRGDGENVTWAYPVTVDQTPHHITFSTGQEIHAA